jgi:hypothetical protein
VQFFLAPEKRLRQHAASQQQEQHGSAELAAGELQPLRGDDAAGQCTDQQQHRERERDRSEQGHQHGAPRSVAPGAQRGERETEDDEHRRAEHAHVVVVSGAERQPRRCDDRMNVEGAR